MRRSVLSVIFMLGLASNVQAAALTPADLQKELNAQLTQMQGKTPGQLQTSGPVTVVDNGNEWIVKYPTFRIKPPQADSTWNVPSIVLTLQAPKNAATSVPFTAALPAHITEQGKDGATLQDIAISGADIQGDWSLKENTLAKMDAKIQSIAWQNNANGQSGRGDNLALQTLTKFIKDDRVNVLTNLQSGAITRNPAPFSAGMMPQTLSLTGQFRDVPKALVVLGALMPLPGMQSAMAGMGTRLDIDQMHAVTQNGAKLSGNGWLKAAPAGGKFPVTGRVTLAFEDLQKTMTDLQRGIGGTLGKGSKDTTQSLLMLMVLQGMGKMTNDRTQYVLDMTPEGEILVNGNDVSPLVNGMGGGGSMLNLFQNTPKVENPPVKSDSI